MTDEAGNDGVHVYDSDKVFGCLAFLLYVSAVDRGMHGRHLLAISREIQRNGGAYIKIGKLL
jgi:hypothetical protein